MARISGVELPKEKRGEIGLTYVFGIGRSTANKILQKAEVNINKKVGTWSEEEASKIRMIVSTYKIEGALKSEISLNIKRLKDISSYRGIRHRSGLPVRGQNTKNNARTRKGPRKTVANKKKVSK